MVETLNNKNIIPIIIGISIPQSYGFRYIDQFRAVFPEVAKINDGHYLDLYREELFTIDGYIQEDGLHPTAITQPIIRDIVHQFLLDQNLITETTTP